MNQRYTTLDDFQPWELEAYLDGEELPHLAEFLAHHPSALAALQQEQAHSNRLRRILYRFDCPPPETLHAYHWDELNRDARRQVELHLHQCPQCSAELADLQAFVGEPLTAANSQETVAPTQVGLVEQLQEWIDQVRVVVATLVTPGGPQFAGVALRNEPTAATAPVTLLFEADDADVSLIAHKQLDGAYQVDGQLFATASLSDIRYVLTSAKAASPALTGKVDTTGRFVIPRVAAGAYQLVIQLPDRAIVIPNLTYT